MNTIETISLLLISYKKLRKFFQSVRLSKIDKKY